MKPQRILVTGGTGYIGSHTVAELVQAGFDVVALDNFSNSRRSVLESLKAITGKEISFVKLDLCNMTAVKDFFSTDSFDAVIHFAAFKSVNESVDDPLKYYRNNLVSLMNLMEVAAANQIDHFVFSSSCSVYGEPDVLPVTEAAVLKKAESPYGYTKQICERMLSDFSKVSSMKIIALRYFNPVGAHASSLIGEYPHNSPNSLVPVITQTAIGLRKQMEVYGTDYNTPDGSAIRDYIHVADVAKAHVSAILRLQKNSSPQKFEIFNLGTGKGNSIFEVIRTFEKVSGRKLNYKLSPRRKGDIVQVYADTTLANKELNWSAKESLESMILSAWNWELALEKMRTDNSEITSATK